MFEAVMGHISNNNPALAHAQRGVTIARGVGDAREGGRRCSRGGSVMLAKGDLQGHHTMDTNSS